MDYSKSKYQNETAEQADAIVNEGLAEATAGDVETGGHYALVVVEGRHVIIRTDSQGFVWVEVEETHHSIDHDHIRRTWETIEAGQAPDEDDEGPSIEPVRFFLGDDDRMFRGYSTGSKWNGFDEVLVTPQVRDRIAAYITGDSDPATDGDIAETLRDLYSMPIAQQYGGLVDMTGWQTIVPTAESRLRRILYRAEDRHARRVTKFDSFRAPGKLTLEQDALLRQSHKCAQALARKYDAIA